MKVAESIYQGFVTTRGTYDDPREIRKAVLELSAAVRNLIPARACDQESRQDIIGAAMELAEQTEKQGFITGFQYAAHMFGVLSGKESV